MRIRGDVYHYTPSPPNWADQAVDAHDTEVPAPSTQATHTHAERKGEREMQAFYSGQVYRTISVLRTMTERSLASNEIESVCQRMMYYIYS